MEPNTNDDDLNAENDYNVEPWEETNKPESNIKEEVTKELSATPVSFSTPVKQKRSSLTDRKELEEPNTARKSVMVTPRTAQAQRTQRGDEF